MGEFGGGGEINSAPIETPSEPVESTDMGMEADSLSETSDLSENVDTTSNMDVEDFGEAMDGSSTEVPEDLGKNGVEDLSDTTTEADLDEFGSAMDGGKITEEPEVTDETLEGADAEVPEEAAETVEGADAEVSEEAAETGEDADVEVPEEAADGVDTEVPEEAVEGADTEVPEETAETVEDETAETTKETAEAENTETEEGGDSEGTDETAETGDSEGTDETGESGDPEGTDESGESGDSEGTDESGKAGDAEGTDETGESGDTEGTDETGETGDTEGTDETGDAEGNNETGATGETDENAAANAENTDSNAENAEANAEAAEGAADGDNPNNPSNGGEGAGDNPPPPNGWEGAGDNPPPSDGGNEVTGETDDGDERWKGERQLIQVRDAEGNVHWIEPTEALRSTGLERYGETGPGGDGTWDGSDGKNPEGGEHEDEPKETKEHPELTEIKMNEGLTLKELKEVREWVEPVYKNGIEIAKQGELFSTYKEHSILEYPKKEGVNEVQTGHIENVRIKSIQAAEAAMEAFAENDYNGLYPATIDKKAVEIAALYHDTGMDGNLTVDEYPERRAEYISGLTESDRKKLEEDHMTPEEGFDAKIRKEHPIQSAIHVLRDSDEIRKLDSDPNKVAFLCELHSKSTSGVKNLLELQQWEQASQKLKDAVQKYNELHPEKKKLEFDDSFLRDKGGKLDESKVAELRTEALVLRLGDSAGHDYRSRRSQNGKSIDFDLSKYNETDHSEDRNYKDEVRSADVRIDGRPLVTETEVDGKDQVADADGIARMYALGEGNFKSIDFSWETDESDNKRVVETIELVDAEAYPFSTQKAIEERIGEINTAKIYPDVVSDANRPTGMSDGDWKELKQEKLDEMTKINLPIRIKLGRANERTQELYEDYCTKMESKYNVEVILDYDQ